jgi:hypothetical protein
MLQIVLRHPSGRFVTENGEGTTLERITVW